MFVFAPALLAIALAPPSSAPRDDHVPLEERLTRGHEFAANLEYESAVLEYSLVLESSDATEDQKQQARLHAAIANRIMRNDVDARVLLLAYFAREPNGTLPPGQYPPKVTTFFELIREEAQRSAPPAPPPPAPVWSLPMVMGSAVVGAAGLALIVGGVATEATLYQTGWLGGANAHLDVADVLGPGIVASGVLVTLGALVFVPWWRQEEGPRGGPHAS